MLLPRVNIFRMDAFLWTRKLPRTESADPRLTKSATEIWLPICALQRNDIVEPVIQGTRLPNIPSRDKWTTGLHTKYRNFSTTYLVLPNYICMVQKLRIKTGNRSMRNKTLYQRGNSREQTLSTQRDSSFVLTGSFLHSRSPSMTDDHPWALFS